MTFRDLLESISNGNSSKKAKEEILKIFEQSNITLKSIPSIGYFGDKFSCLLVFQFDNLKSAQSQSIADIIKLVSKFTPVVLSKDKDYPSGTYIESSDWQKDSSADPHELYINLKGK